MRHNRTGRGEPPSKGKHIFAFVIGCLVILVTTILWILSSYKILGGTTTDTFIAIGTAIGLLVALMSLFRILERNTFSDPLSELPDYLDETDIKREANKCLVAFRVGARLNISAININYGLDETGLQPYRIVTLDPEVREQYRVGATNLWPGGYIAYTDSTSHKRKISAVAGQVIEIELH